MNLPERKAWDAQARLKGKGLAARNATQRGGGSTSWRDGSIRASWAAMRSGSIGLLVLVVQVVKAQRASDIKIGSCIVQPDQNRETTRALPTYLRQVPYNIDLCDPSVHIPTKFSVTVLS